MSRYILAASVFVAVSCTSSGDSSGTASIVVPPDIRGSGQGSLEIMQQEVSPGDVIELVITGRTAGGQLVLEKYQLDWRIIAVLFPAPAGFEPGRPRPEDDDVVLDDVGAPANVPLFTPLPADLAIGQYRVCDVGSREGTVCDGFEVVPGRPDP